jgi:hypothetical protein
MICLFKDFSIAEVVMLFFHGKLKWKNRFEARLNNNFVTAKGNTFERNSYLFCVGSKQYYIYKNLALKGQTPG